MFISFSSFHARILVWRWPRGRVPFSSFLASLTSELLLAFFTQSAAVMDFECHSVSRVHDGWAALVLLPPIWVSPVSIDPFTETGRGGGIVLYPIHVITSLSGSQHAVMLCWLAQKNTS